MPFNAGRVSFCRFHVAGDAPTRVDTTALDILQQYAFKETPVGAPDEVEVGFATGEHLLDTQFTYEKNAYGDSLFFAMRIDTHKPPADVRKAYRKINEQAAAAASPTGFASKAERKDAADMAARQLHEDLAAGKFRRSKLVQILWHLPSRTMYCAAASNAVIEQLVRLMREAFAVRLEYLSAGAACGQLLRDAGKGRDYEDLKPSAFTKPPARAVAQADDAEGPRTLSSPLVPWVVQSTDLKDFLGNEWLMWLWWLAEEQQGAVPLKASTGRAEAFVTLDKSLDMDCAWEVGGKQTLRGDGPTRLPEAAEALRTGKWPRKAGLIVSDGEHQWELAIQADRMIVTAAALPDIEDATSPRELTEARIDLTLKLSETLAGMYAAFLDQRIGGGWEATRTQSKQRVPPRHGPAGQKTPPHRPLPFLPGCGPQNGRTPRRYSVNRLDGPGAGAGHPHHRRCHQYRVARSQDQYY